MADQIFDRREYPHCIGALDSNHILIDPPKGGWKQAIMLLALTGIQDEFLYAEVCIDDQTSDEQIWVRSGLRQSLECNRVGLPEPSNLPNSNRAVPHHIVADQAFPLTSQIMKPFGRKETLGDESKRMYNLRYV